MKMCRWTVVLLWAWTACGEKKDAPIAATVRDDASVQTEVPQRDAAEPALVNQNVATEARPSSNVHIITATETITGDLRQADGVFIATVESADSFQLDDYPFMQTNVHLSVSETIEGNADSVVTINGGRVGDVAVLAPHAPSFELGKRFLIFTLTHHVVDVFAYSDPDTVQVHGELVPLSSVRALAHGGAP